MAGQQPNICNNQIWQQPNICSISCIKVLYSKLNQILYNFCLNSKTNFLAEKNKKIIAVFESYIITPFSVIFFRKKISHYKLHDFVWKMFIGFFLSLHDLYKKFSEKPT